MKTDIDIVLDCNEFEGTVWVQYDDSTGEIFSVEQYNDPRALNQPITSPITVELSDLTNEYIQEMIYDEIFDQQTGAH